MAEALIPTTNRGFGSRDGPEAIFVRLRTNVEPAAALLTLKRDAAGMSTDPNDGPVSVLAVQRPAEIVNYRTMGTTPALLGIGLAAGAATALGLTLIASVRRRRRDLALLKTLGFTRRQLAAVVIWQASVAAVIGTVVGRTARDHRRPRAMEPVCRGDPCGPKRERARRLRSPSSPSVRSSSPTSSPPSPDSKPPAPQARYCSTPTEHARPKAESPVAPTPPSACRSRAKTTRRCPDNTPDKPRTVSPKCGSGAGNNRERGTRVRADPAHYFAGTTP